MNVRNKNYKHINICNILQAAKPVNEVPAAQPAAILNVIIIF